MRNSIPQFAKIFLAAILFACSTDRTNHQNDLFSWEISTPSVEGVDSLVLEFIHKEINEGVYGLIDHFLIIRNSKIIYDKHYEYDYESLSKKYDTTNFQYNYDHPAWHPYYNYSDLHTLQSVTKSVTSILVGIAIDEGLIEDVNVPVMPFFTDYDIDLNDERRNSITLKNLLTMQAGIKWDEESTHYLSPENNCNVMELSDDWIQYVLSLPMENVPGTKFTYNGGASILLGKIISIATGKRIDKWAEEKLFRPLGITEYYWKKTPLEEIDTEGGLYLTPYDIAKIANLFLYKGKWQGKQIVSEEWVKESITPYYIDIEEDFGYGYQWWLREIINGTAEIIAMSGFGGQHILMAPKYNVLVLTMGWNIHESSTPGKSIRHILKDLIIPAIKK